MVLEIISGTLDHLQGIIVLSLDQGLGKVSVDIIMRDLGQVQSLGLALGLILGHDLGIVTTRRSQGGLDLRLY
jgi:hypothetical protein